VLPVEGGAFTTSSVGSAIPGSLPGGAKDLLVLAQKMAGSPLAGAKLDQVLFTEGKWSALWQPGASSIRRPRAARFWAPSSGASALRCMKGP